MTVKRIILGALAVFFFVTSPVDRGIAAQPSSDNVVGGVVIPNVVARVNGVEISDERVKFQFMRVMRSIRKPIDLRQKNKIIRDLIDKEIIRELVYQKGKEENITVDSQTLKTELEALKKPYENEGQFQKELERREITEKDLRHSLEMDLVAQELLSRKVKGKVHITNEDVKKYYEENKKEFYRPQAYRARHIFVSLYPPDLMKTKPAGELRAKKEEYTRQAKEKVEKIMEKVRSGADFAKLAKQFSEDEATAANGGDLDFIYQGVLEPAFDEAVAQLDPGEVSGIVKTRYGFHIIKLLETKPPEQAPFSEMKEAIQKHLFQKKAQERIQEYIEDQKKQAEIKVFF